MRGGIAPPVTRGSRLRAGVLEGRAGRPGAPSRPFPGGESQVEAGGEQVGGPGLPAGGLTPHFVAAPWASVLSSSGSVWAATLVTRSPARPQTPPLVLVGQLGSGQSSLPVLPRGPLTPQSRLAAPRPGPALGGGPRPSRSLQVQGAGPGELGGLAPPPRPFPPACPGGVFFALRGSCQLCGVSFCSCTDSGSLNFFFCLLCFPSLVMTVLPAVWGPYAVLYLRLRHRNAA